MLVQYRISFFQLPAAMMLFQTISTLSLLAASAIAAPQKAPATFDVMALRSASPIHFAEVSAAKGGLFLNLPHSNATCEGKSSGHVTFYIEGEELVLYSCKGEKQKVFVDRSGMGAFSFSSSMSLSDLFKLRYADSRVQGRASYATLQGSRLSLDMPS